MFQNIILTDRIIEQATNRIHMITSLFNTLEIKLLSHFSVTSVVGLHRVRTI